ncbi:MAG TPA: hypothetical protein VL326_34620 [Kofleriaceae bacterium]|nr:hypothetical protein [Kofleriaceae bacterium]
MNRSIALVMVFVGAACGDDASSSSDAGGDGPNLGGDGNQMTGNGPTLGGCPVLPDNHVFNTKIDQLPVDPNSAAYISTIGGSVKLHLDLGQTVDQTQTDFYGIPYNVAAMSAATWPTVAYTSPDPGMNWNPKPESDCADASHTIVSPCDTIAQPKFPIMANPLVEGGISTASNHMPYGDHHILILDTDSCLLWETYHSYYVSNAWQIFGSAVWDMRSNKLRTPDWSSADAAGFPILPLLLKEEEASSGTIKHALRFTINTPKLRNVYTWPATHVANDATDPAFPPYGQLFRLKASYQIPANYNVQSKAILTAMKEYGMYIADGGSDMYITGAASANWMDSTFSEVQSVAASNFEAVDLTPFKQRAGWSATSAAVPSP